MSSGSGGVTYGDTAASMAQTARYDATQSSRATSEFSRSIEARQFFEIDQSADALLALKRARSIDARPLRVALQFPDDLLADARLVTTLLRDAAAQRQFEADFYILGDTSYGSCCVDEVAAQHASVDFLIHYGKSCLSTTTRLASQLVFGRRIVDVDALLACLVAKFAASSAVPVLFYDTDYEHALSDAAFRRRLADALPRAIVSELVDKPSLHFVAAAVAPPIDAACASSSSSSSSSACDATACCKSTSSVAPPAPLVVAERRADPAPTHIECVVQGRSFLWPRAALDEGGGTWRSRLPIDTFAPVFLGDARGACVASLQLALQRHPFDVLVFTPAADGAALRGSFALTPLSPNVLRLLMRRHALIERARDAKAIAIVVGTLAAARHGAVLAHLRRLIRAYGVSCYTLVVGKLNEPKLANIATADMFCLIGCRESTYTAIAERGYGAPIITPLEIQIAFQRGCEWDCDYSLDFDEVLRRHALVAALPIDDVTKRRDGGGDDDDDEVHASLVTQSVTQRRKVALVDVDATTTATASDDAAPATRTSNELMLSTLASGALMNLTTSVAVTRFEQRGFRGLEPRVGDDAPAVVRPGRRGIAIGYDDEPAAPNVEGKPS